MSATSRSFSPVWCKGEQCLNDEYHFHGAAREVYSYLKLLALRHGGFVFASVGDITEHTKRWSKGRVPFSQSHCERILRMFRELGILGDRDTRTIHGRRYSGWQMASHVWWAESHGGICDFKHWGEFESKRRQCMGNAKCESYQQNDGRNDGPNDGPNDGDFDRNDGQNDGAQTIVIEPKLRSPLELQTASAG